MAAVAPPLEPSSPSKPGLAAQSSFSLESSSPAVPSLFRKDRLRLQCVGLVCLAYSLSSKVSIFDQISALAVSRSAVLPLDAIDLGLPEIDGLHIELPAWQVCALLVAVALAACWEAGRFPRQCAHASAMDMLRTVLELIGDVLLIPVYILSRPEVPKLSFQPSARNEKIVGLCPSMASFKQTPWFRNPNLAFGMLMHLDSSGAEKARKFVRRELVETPDGGSIALDWWEDRPDIAESKKVLLVGSTFTGDALVDATKSLCQHFSSLGYRPVVMVKRGCGRTMINAQPGYCGGGGSGANAGVPSSCDGISCSCSSLPWCLAGFDDFELAVDHVANKCQGLPICAVGLSTGGGQLRSYLTRLGERSKLTAAVVVDAAPSWVTALQSCDKRIPLISKALVAVAHESYGLCGHGKANKLDNCAEADLDGTTAMPPPKPLPRVMPGGLVEFVRDNMAPKHGFGRSLEGAYRYMAHCSPPAGNPATPCLEMVTYDDQLINPPDVDVIGSYWKYSPNVFTLVNRQGTHVIRWNGLRRSNWIAQVTSEFCEAAVSIASAEKSAQQPGGVDVSPGGEEGAAAVVTEAQ